MSKIPCSVIRDLFPSYIDKLTSEESNQLVEEHLAQCKDCEKILHDMQDGNKQSYKPTEKEKKEIDFLKKNKRRNFRIGIYCIIGALLCAALILFIRAVGDGMQMLGDENWHVEKITVENGEIHFKASAVNSFAYIYKIYVDEGKVAGENTVVITPMLVFVNPFHAKDKEFTYHLSYPQKAKTIYFGTKIIYADGEEINPRASELFGTRHQYVGNASSNVRTANEIHLADLLGPFENELETKNEPYGWIIKLQTDVTSKERSMREGYMDSSACVMIALIQNLDHVTFQYRVDGEATSKTITAADAAQIFGQDVKNCYESPKIFQALLTKLGWK